MNRTNSLEQNYQEEKERAYSFLEWDAEWDGYSAKKIDKESFEKQLYVFDLCLKEELPMPRIIPNSDGMVEITWKNKDKDAYIIYEKEEGFHLFFYE